MRTIEIINIISRQKQKLFFTQVCIHLHLYVVLPRFALNFVTQICKR